MVPQFNEDRMQADQIEIGPRRMENDGFTFFGVEDGQKNDEGDAELEDSKQSYVENENGQQVPKTLMNDFIIPMNNPNLSADASKDQPSINPMMGGGTNSHQGRQFYIQYDTYDNQYKIRDLGKGYGAFAKLQGSIIIRDSFLINIGESYVVAYLMNNQEDWEDSQ